MLWMCDHHVLTLTSKVRLSEDDLSCSIRGFYKPLVLPETMGTPYVTVYRSFMTVLWAGNSALGAAVWSVHNSYVVYCHQRHEYKYILIKSKRRGV